MKMGEGRGGHFSKVGCLLRRVFMDMIPNRGLQIQESLQRWWESSPGGGGLGSCSRAPDT